MAALCSAQHLQPYMTALVPELCHAPNLRSTRVWILGRWSLSSMALCLGRARRPDYLGINLPHLCLAGSKVVLEIAFF